MATLNTIGYERADLEKFVRALQTNRIEYLVDVRQVPISRKRGFSKTSLREALEKAGIKYIHLKALGDPKSGREAAKAGRFAEFNEIYRRHLATPAAQDALSLVGDIANSTNSCLMCYERTPEYCHRKVVAEAVSHAYNVAVHHMFVEIFVSDSERTAERRVSVSAGEGGAAPQPAAW